VGNFAHLVLSMALRYRQTFSSTIVQIALIPVFSALSLATNYAMIDIPNVKLMDAFIFIAAFLFGLKVGIGSAILTWGVYGFINPYGSDDLTLLSFLILGECFYALAGVLLSRVATVRELLNNEGRYARLSILFGLVGFQTTFAYDVLTNFGSWMFKTTSLYHALVIGLITGLPFAIVHEASNLAFFATVVPLGIAAARRIGFTTREEVPQRYEKE
jgi:uncharacterized membrane protein